MSDIYRLKEIYINKKGNFRSEAIKAYAIVVFICTFIFVQT